MKPCSGFSEMATPGCQRTVQRDPRAPYDGVLKFRRMAMTRGRLFYSVNEASKPPARRVHHDDERCGAGKMIPERERIYGRTNEYRLCEDCQKYR